MGELMFVLYLNIWGAVGEVISLWPRLALWLLQEAQTGCRMHKHRALQ